MLIHKSHSKKDLIELFGKLNVKIDTELSKGKIMMNIDDYIERSIYNEKIKNKTQLIKLLCDLSSKQRPTIQEKQKIMFISKKIVKFCNEGEFFNDSTFQTSEEVYNNLILIHRWGDIPSVRRACKLYNKSTLKINHVNPVISENVLEEINNKRILSKSYLNNLKIRFGTEENPIIVSFD